ncbi:tRNA (adenosine(37)-N6)-threonylcarbamoyltransferase complex dimerization subunit type 1 TsaB [candidate division TA06 bacterium]|uniref:tRNA (Adenosine(37)-N6)-threonylcarbamoyltransferase complex dimerization subunit type 1 TsaB n=3 Tax=candidate division TA06 bacterium TaxID=2250710 RepID=A0A523UVS2_UNCT6|nr:MAG: tRNA (adenosine(37)-N6)-threonylcarbamoyltransferase complex dimerization subunit type 1 TsaB [candidate division TA06 bacterium]
MNRLILGIETSSDFGGVALADEGGVVAEELTRRRLNHSEELVKLISSALKGLRSGLDDLQGVAVSIGPGSFTGLRVGLAAAKGLCLSKGLPLLGIPSLDALASMCPESSLPVHAIIDAKRGEVYWSSYRYESGMQTRTGEYIAVTPQGLVERISEETMLIGSGVDVYRDFIVENRKGLAKFVTPNPQSPLPSVIAVLGLQRLKANQIEEIESLEPIYIRPSDAEIKEKNG